MKIKIGKLNRYLVNAICILGFAMPAFADTLKYNVSDTDPSGPHMLKMIQLALITLIVSTS
jgi:hypothetical protein